MTTALTTTANMPRTSSQGRWPLAVVPGLLLMTSAVLGTPQPIYWSTSTPAPFTAWASTLAGEHVGAPTSSYSGSATPPISEQVEMLRTLSGLTTDQVARLMSVSRRSIHNWISGSLMSSANEERLSRLVAVIRSIPGAPSDRRAKLLDSSAGTSMFHRLLGEHSRDADIQVNPLTPRERLGL